MGSPLARDERLVDSFIATPRLRVADIEPAYRDWSELGVHFLTEPKDHDRVTHAGHPRILRGGASDS